MYYVIVVYFNYFVSKINFRSDIGAVIQGVVFEVMGLVFESSDVACINIKIKLRKVLNILLSFSAD